MPPLPFEYQGYFESFQRWFDRYVKKVHLIETILEDLDMGFKGTPDLIVTMIDDIMTIPDYKTPKAKSPIWCGQLAAYQHLATKNGYPAQKVGALRLHKDGKQAIFDHYSTSPSDFIAFHAALTAYRYLMKGEFNGP